MTFPTFSNPAQINAPLRLNELFQALAFGAPYARNGELTAGLVWHYYGGRWGGFAVTAASLTLTASQTNYIVVAIATGVISFSTSNTNWNDGANYKRVYLVITGATTVTSYEDHRAGPGGIHGGAPGASSGSGGATGLEFTASSTTADADPGTGTIRWNNATHSAATILYIDNAEADGVSLATFWANVTNGSFIKITKADDVDVWQLWKVTATPVDGTGYYKFTVSLQAQEGATIANGVAVLISVDAAAAAGAASPKVVQVAFSDQTTAITAGVAKVTFRMPYAMTLNAGSAGIRASLKTAQTSGAIFTVDVNEGGASILSTKLTIDNTEKTSTTAATPPVLSDTSLADDAEITVDVDGVGDGTAIGGILTLIGT